LDSVNLGFMIPTVVYGARYRCRGLESFPGGLLAHHAGAPRFEAARLRIAQLNGCVFCLDWRTERDGVKVEAEFADAVTEWRTTDAFDERTRLAAEYAERYTLDHHGIDDEFWKRMGEHYSQKEIVELSIGSWLAFGRLNHVLGIDAVCVLPG